MPTTFPFVFAPEDEREFLAFVGEWELTVYPERIPRDWKPLVAGPGIQQELTEEAYYLALERDQAVVLNMMKKGPNKGYLMIDELACPVMHYARSVVDENGELRSGRVWAEINLNGDAQKNPVLTGYFRKLVTQTRDWFNTKCLRSTPAGYFIGPAAAKLEKTGKVMRAEGHRGVVLRGFRRTP